MKRMVLAFLATIALTFFSTPAMAQNYYWPPQGPSVTYEQHCRVESRGYGIPPQTVCPPPGGYYPPPQQWALPPQYGGYYPPPQQWGPPPQYGGYYPPQGGYGRPTGCRDNYGRRVAIEVCHQYFAGGGYGGYPPPQPYYGDRRGHLTFSFTYSQ